MAIRYQSIALAFAVLGAVGCADKAASGPKPQSPTPLLEDTEGDDVPPPRDLTHSCGISVSSSPTGAKVLVDGKEAGKTPTTIEGLSMGTHDVTFVYESGERATLSVELAEGEYKSVHHSYTPNASDAHLLKKKE